MIVPSIDLRGGQAVQLVGGETLAIEAGDPRPLADAFGVVGPLAVIDLDVHHDLRSLLAEHASDHASSRPLSPATAAAPHAGATRPTTHQHALVIHDHDGDVGVVGAGLDLNDAWSEAGATRRLGGRSCSTAGPGEVASNSVRATAAVPTA